MTRPPLRLLVLAGALVLGAAVGQGLSASPDVPAPAPAVPVQSASAVCADVRQGEGVTSRVAAGLAPGAGDGGVLVEGFPVAGGEPAVLPVVAPGDAATGLAAEVTDDGYAVQARGAGAAGLTAVLTAQVAAGPERGLASQECLSARTDGWLLGGAATVSDTAVLVLVNPEPVEAAVDLTVLSAEGPVDARRGRGLTVPAAGRLLVGLDALAPDRSSLAVRVRATRGRVASALRHSRTSGDVPQGLALAAASDGPAQELVVPALPAGPGSRAVLLANPAEVDVTARVELTTADGQFVPIGLDALLVPAGSTLVADLSDALAVTPGALRVTATGGPLLAAGVVDDGAPTEAAEVRDLAYVGALPPLSGAALLPDLPLDGATGTTLLLSALTGDAAVEVELRPVAGAADPGGGSRRVEVPGGRTVAVVLAELAPGGQGPAAAAAVVVVRPDEGTAPVHASLVRVARSADGPLLSVLSLRGSRPDAARARVVRDPAAGLD